MRTTDLKGLRVAVTGGTSGLGLALVRQLAAQGARVAFVARTAAAVEAHRRRDRRPRHCRRRRAQGRHLPDRAADHRQPRRARRADQQCVEPRPGAAGAACRHRMRGAGAGAGGQSASAPFRLTKALFGALAASARDGRGALVINISSDAAVNAYPGWGAYGASKAALAPSDGDLGRGGQGRRRAIPRDRSRRHGYAAARAGGSRCRSARP